MATSSRPSRPPGPVLWRACWRPVAVAMAAASGGWYVRVVDPSSAGHYPLCPFLAVTGWYCPGCGSLRAVHALGSGDLGAAFSRNPLTVIALIYLAVTWVSWLERSLTGRSRRALAPPWVLYAGVASVVAFTVARNVPGWDWLSPT